MAQLFIALIKCLQYGETFELNVYILLLKESSFNLLVLEGISLKDAQKPLRR